jgi:hypothetical protein
MSLSRAAAIFGPPTSMRSIVFFDLYWVGVILLPFASGLRRVWRQVFAWASQPEQSKRVSAFGSGALINLNFLRC